MMSIVIDVKSVSKRYRIGLREKKHETLTGQLMSVVRAPFRNFRRLTSMTKFSDDDESVFWALKEVNFSVTQGEVLGVIGRNGAGKSTLLKILSRITEPTSGEIAVNGRISSLLEVGTGFHPELTGRENIFMNGTILGMTRREIDSKLDEIIEFSGIDKFVDTAVKFYSSGMKVRLGFSVAAHLEPEILIIDEVLAVGDVEFQRRCLGKMQNVAKSGRTVIFVSHSMASIRNLCSRCMVMNGGRLIFSGDVDAAVGAYIAQNGTNNLGSTFKKSSIANSAIEVLEGEVVGEDHKTKDQFNADEDILIRLVFNKNEPLRGIMGYIQVRGEADDIYIESDTYDRLPNLLDELELGKHNLILRIPRRVLPKGTFKVYLNFTSIYSLKGHSVDSPGEILRFEVYDTTTQRGPRRIALTNSIVTWNRQ